MRTRAVILSFGAIYFACCLAIAVVLGEFAFHPARVPIDRQREARTVVAGFGAKLQNVTIRAVDSTELQAWFVRPKDSNGNSIILLHGIGDNRRGMVGLAKLFLIHGYSVLLPDSRGQGSSGGLPTYGIREKGDILQWFSWLHTHEKPRCIYGMGESMGAAILLQAVKSVPFCAVVSESSFANFREISYLRVGQYFNTGSWLGRIALRPAVEFAFLYCRLRYGVWLSSISPEMSVARSRVPILLIHGLSDNNIPIEQSQIILENCPANSSLWKVPNAGHCGAFSAAAPEFESRVLSWFSTHGAYPENTAIQF
jgi:pimeloyl-ACP methyl ester carboxylesterase